MTKEHAELKERFNALKVARIRQAWQEAAEQLQNTNKSAIAMQDLLDAYCRADAEFAMKSAQEIAKSYQVQRAKHILDYILCDYPFKYFNLMMISPSDRNSIVEAPSIAAEMDEKFKKEKPKILVDEATLKLFIDIIPDFFDGLTLISESDVRTSIDKDVESTMKAF